MIRTAVNSVEKIFYSRLYNNEMYGRYLRCGISPLTKLKLFKSANHYIPDKSYYRHINYKEVLDRVKHNYINSIKDKYNSLSIKDINM